MSKIKPTWSKKTPRSDPNNNGSITCLPTMWKIVTAQISEEIYYWLNSRGLFPEEQKGCYKETKGTGDTLMKTSTRTTNQDEKMYIWRGFAKKKKKVCNMLPKIWIIDCLKMYTIFDEVIMFMECGIDSRREREIFQEDAQSQLLLVIAMMPFNHIENDTNFINCKNK